MIGEFKSLSQGLSGRGRGWARTRVTGHERVLDDDTLSRVRVRPPDGNAVTCRFDLRFRPFHLRLLRQPWISGHHQKQTPSPAG
jgi:hypothetical protein